MYETLRGNLIAGLIYRVLDVEERWTEQHTFQAIGWATMKGSEHDERGFCTQISACTQTGIARPQSSICRSKGCGSCPKCSKYGKVAGNARRERLTQLNKVKEGQQNAPTVANIAPETHLRDPTMRYPAFCRNEESINNVRLENPPQKGTVSMGYGGKRANEKGTNDWNCAMR